MVAVQMNPLPPHAPLLRLQPLRPDRPSLERIDGMYIAVDFVVALKGG
jgi:hypothetical protein